MVFYLIDYSMSNFEQIKARIHSAGQQKNSVYIYLIAKITVTEKILTAFQNKANLVKNLNDDYKNWDNNITFDLLGKLKTLKDKKNEIEITLKNSNDINF